MENNNLYPCILEIGRAFSKAAESYDQAAFVQMEIGSRLLDKLSFIKLCPLKILDLGSGTGTLTQQLTNLFPDAETHGLDLAWGMTRHARQQHSQAHYCCGNMESLPYAADSFDLVFSNCTLQWCSDLSAVFQEIGRVLKPEGVLLFSTLGPDTLVELRQSFTAVDPFPHVHPFMDMHHVGDHLLRSQLVDPVVDTEMLTTLYSSVKTLMRDLKRTGTQNLSPHRRKGLSGKNMLKEMMHQYEQNFRTDQGRIYASYEIIYGYARKSEKTTSTTENREDTFYFSNEDIRYPIPS